MIGMVVTYCVCDDLPIESSKAYSAIKSIHGKEIADRLTYEKTVTTEGDPPVMGSRTAV